jgi:hypothetical protein
MKNAILLILSFMLLTSSVWARSSRQTINLELDNQDVTLLNSTYKSEQRVMIISDEKCRKEDSCYRNKPVKGMIRVRHISSNLSATYFYKIVHGSLEWNMVVFQEAQKNGYVDVVIDRISDQHASAWSAFQPYKCDDQGSYSLPNIDLSHLEDRLNTSIHSTSDLVYSPETLNKFLTNFDGSVAIEEEIQEQLSKLPAAVNAIAAATAIYTTQENPTTLYDFMNDGDRIDRNLNMIVNHTIPAKFHDRVMNRVLREVNAASKVGATLFSSAWFNLMKKQNECYTLDDQIVNDLLD